MPIGASEPVRLVADVGGSNARFALLRGDSNTPVEARTLPTADFPNLADAIEHYLSLCGSSAVIEGAIAIANPVTGDAIRMTNHHWAFSIEETRQRLRMQRLLLLNDFTALALALPWLPVEELRQFGGGKPLAAAPIALLGPGTGLGVSGLLPAGEQHWVPIAGEGGHVTLAAADDREAAIIAVCREEVGHVSAERLLSGMGLSNLHKAISLLAGKPGAALTAAEVTQRGLSGEDAFCAEALAIFCSLLGNVAGNLALTLGARGGVYVGGGIVPRLGDYFHRSAFRQRFEAKGRFAEYLAPIPVFVIHANNPALIGAASALRDSPSSAGC